MSQEDLITQGKRFAQQGQFQAAIGIFREVGGADGTYYEAACLLKMGQTQEARAAAERCLGIDREDHPLHGRYVRAAHAKIGRQRNDAHVYSTQLILGTTDEHRYTQILH